MAGFLWRTSVILHRYLGIAVGLLMLIWFLSGIVMMYVGFPQPLGAERLLSLPMINWQTCCQVGDGMLPDGQPVARAEIEMLRGAPVLRLPRPPAPDQTINLADGSGVSTLELAEAQEVALAAMTRTIGVAPPIAASEEVWRDQWILYRFDREQPVYRFTFADAEGTVLYVSGQSSKVLELVRCHSAFDLFQRPAHQQVVVDTDGDLDLDHRQFPHLVWALPWHRPVASR